MNRPRTPSPRLLLSLPALLLALAACGSSAAPGWTFAPLAPTVPPAPSPAGSPGQSPAGSPGQSPAGSPGQSPAGSAGQAVNLQVTTPADNVLAFDPNELSAPASSQTTIEYNNESNLPHNVHIFQGSDPSAGTLVQTEIITGPGASTSATFTTPAQAGDYFFHCDVHPNMQGTLRVGQ